MTQKTHDFHFLEQFWLRVGLLSGRSKMQKKWVASPELRAWNEANPGPCGRCAQSTKKKCCKIDLDSAGCLTCKGFKLSCDRRALFIFTYTRDEFFGNFEEFMEVFRRRPPKEIRAVNKSQSRIRRRVIEALTTNTAQSPIASHGNGVPTCGSCIQNLARETTNGRLREQKQNQSWPEFLEGISRNEAFRDLVLRFGYARDSILALRSDVNTMIMTGDPNNVHSPRSVFEQLRACTEYYESFLVDPDMLLSPTFQLS